MRLITIPMSHYCEKARWALERLGLEYYEERHLQVFHYPRTWWISGGPSVPVLVDGERVVADSTAILQHLDRYAGVDTRLYPENPEERAEVERLEDLFDEVVGVESRRWVYFHYRGKPVQAARIAGVGTPWHEKVLMPLAYPLFVFLINKLLEPSPANVERGLERVREITQQTDALLASGRRYLTGDRFTAADLALAAMLAPLVLPENYGIPLPRVDELPLAARPAVEEFRATRSGRFVLRLYQDERVAPAAAGGFAG